MTRPPTAEWLSFNWLVPEIVMVPASDGVMVPAHIYRPKDMGASPNGAAVIFVHGAGYLHNVDNFWTDGIRASTCSTSTSRRRATSCSTSTTAARRATAATGAPRSTA